MMTEDPQPGARRPDQLTEEAATWFARMRGPEADAHRPRFEAWLARGALHRSAYNRAAEIFSMGKFLEADALASLPASHEAIESVPYLGTRRAMVIAGAAACALLATWLAIGPPLTGIDNSHPSGRPAQMAMTVDLVTAADESRVERLADGSVVTLGAGSRLRVRFGESRRLELMQGRARFDVAHELRPFIVDARGTLVTARGTIFDVRIERADRVTVHLIQGLVDVEAPRKAPGLARTHRLRPGQSLVTLAHPDQVRTPTGIQREASASTAPALSGVREFHGVRLDALVAEANRSARVPIVLSDPRLGEIRISGRFTLSNTAELAERTAAVFDLAIDRSDHTKIVLARK